MRLLMSCNKSLFTPNSTPSLSLPVGLASFRLLRCWLEDALPSNTDNCCSSSKTNNNKHKQQTKINKQIILFVVFYYLEHNFKNGL